MKKITIVDGDDWQGIYVDGELKAEGHELQLLAVFEAIGLRPVFVEADLDWLADEGSLPKDLSDVRLRS